MWELHVFVYICTCSLHTCGLLVLDDIYPFSLLSVKMFQKDELESTTLIVVVVDKL